jgi:D-xylose 1-dehydrogenase (NADP+, D-xylono-1,5-lactone-forming)
VSEPVRWGILSTARINRLLLAGARKSKLVQVVAVGSRDGARARAFADEHGMERAHGSYEDLLEDPSVEAVYVPLPNSLHVEWTLHALASGKHVLCEKPLTRRPEEVEEVFAAADRAGLLVMEAFMYRHHPQTRRLQELLAEGAIGEVRLIRSAFSFMLTRPGDVRLSRALDGGALMDVGCYCVSGARLVAGEPEDVRALRLTGASGVDVRFAGMLRFPGDVLAHFDCALDLPGRSALEVVGSEGRLFIADPWHCRQPGIELQRGSELRRIDVESADSYQLELENFSSAIRNEQPPLLGREDAQGQARALAALLDADECAELDDRAW